MSEAEGDSRMEPNLFVIEMDGKKVELSPLTRDRVQQDTTDDEALASEEEIAHAWSVLDTVEIQWTKHLVRLVGLFVLALTTLAVAILVPMSQTRLAFLLSLTLLLAWWCISDADGLLTLSMHMRRVRSMLRTSRGAMNSVKSA